MLYRNRYTSTTKPNFFPLLDFAAELLSWFRHLSSINSGFLETVAWIHANFTDSSLSTISPDQFFFNFQIFRIFFFFFVFDNIGSYACMLAKFQHATLSVFIQSEPNLMINKIS